MIETFLKKFKLKEHPSHVLSSDCNRSGFISDPWHDFSTINEEERSLTGKISILRIPKEARGCPGGFLIKSRL